METRYKLYAKQDHSWCHLLCLFNVYLFYYTAYFFNVIRHDPWDDIALLGSCCFVDYLPSGSESIPQLTWVFRTKVCCHKHYHGQPGNRNWIFKFSICNVKDFFNGLEILWINEMKYISILMSVYKLITSECKMLSSISMHAQIIYARKTFACSMLFLYFYTMDTDRKVHLALISCGWAYTYTLLDIL